VGFIRKLPYHLVEAFKATLEELQEADLLVHVIDASHPMVDEQIKAVLGVLRDLGVHEKPILSVLNKMDRDPARQNRTRLADQLVPSVAVSAIKGEGFDDLRSALADCLRNRHKHLHLRVPLTEGKLLASIRSSGTLFSERYDDDSAILDVAVPDRLQPACTRYIVEPEAAPHGN
jgi:GTP-binding protein HflX